jgi:hypothetical protein
MTPQRFRDCLTITGLTDSQLMKTIDCDDRLIRRMKSGAREVPPMLEGWLERLVEHWHANPPPRMRGRPHKE